MPRSSRTPERARRWTLIALAACVVWLLVQNSLILVWLSSQHLEPAFVVARALTRVGLRLAADWWMVPPAVILGVALALTGSERETSSRAHGVSHVG